MVLARGRKRDEGKEKGKLRVWGVAELRKRWQRGSLRLEYYHGNKWQVTMDLRLKMMM